MTSANYTPITLIKPASYIPAAYHKIYSKTTQLIEEHEPDLVLHMGLAVDRDYFAVEKSALKEGYHEIPDVDRKVVTRAENLKWFGKKTPDVLVSQLKLEEVVEAWQVSCAGIRMPGADGGKKGGGSAAGKIGSAKGKGKEGNGKGKSTVDVRLSDDVGTYVCGFMYYVSLLGMEKKKGRRDVTFLHVPPLQGQGEIDVGVQVVKELIIALVGAWEDS